MLLLRSLKLASGCTTPSMYLDFLERTEKIYNLAKEVSEKHGGGEEKSELETISKELTLVGTIIREGAKKEARVKKIGGRLQVRIRIP